MAGLSLNDPRHGTPGGYGYHHCRCGLCREAHSIAVCAERERRISRPTPDHVHGTTNGYNNYRCRCERCCEAYTRYRRSTRPEPTTDAAKMRLRTHGRYSMYRYQGCRCDRCRAAAATYRAGQK